MNRRETPFGDISGLPGVLSNAEPKVAPQLFPTPHSVSRCLPLILVCGSGGRPRRGRGHSQPFQGKQPSPTCLARSQDVPRASHFCVEVCGSPLPAAGAQLTHYTCSRRCSRLHPSTKLLCAAGLTPLMPTPPVICLLSTGYSRPHLRGDAGMGGRGGPEDRRRPPPALWHVPDALGHGNNKNRHSRGDGG